MPLDKRVADRVLRDLDNVYYTFADLWNRSRRNVRFYANDQWTTEEKQALARQGRLPYVFNKIAPQVENIRGAQKQTRMDVRCAPVEQGDEKASEVLNRLIKWAEQINTLQDKEAEIFKDGLLSGAGFTQVRWVFEDFEGGAPRVERIPIYQMMWDLNATAVDLTDARWMARVIPMRRQEVKEYFPQYAEFADKAPLFSATRNYNLWESLTKMQRDTRYWVSNFRDRDLVFVTEHYERVRTTEFMVIDTVDDEVLIFDTEQEAQDCYEGRMAVHTIGVDPLVQESGEETVMVQPFHRDRFIQTILIGYNPVQQVMTDLPAFPYQPFFANFVDGECWSYVDGLISPQRFYNRMASEWDNQIGRGNKQLTTVIESLLPKGWDLEKVRREKSKTGAVIPVQRHDALNVIPNQPASPDIPNMLGVTAQFIAEFAGGNNILGLEENAAESGKTVRARQAAAGLARVPMYANLRTWRRSVTELLLWYMKEYLTDRQIQRIIGTDPDLPAELVELDADTIDTIRNARTDIQIQPTAESDLAREETFNQVLQFLQTGAAAAIDPNTQLFLLLELNPSMPRDVKDKIFQSTGIFQQISQVKGQQAEQSEIEHSVDKSLLRADIKEQKMQERAFSAAGLM